jgi:hypothetical protein
MLTSIPHGRTGVTVLRLAGVSDVRSRHVHRARERFGPHADSVNSALMFVRDHLEAWSMRDKVAVASTVTTVFAENVLCHRWGNTPTSTGKTVWARIGAGDTFAGITGLLQ